MNTLLAMRPTPSSLRCPTIPASAIDDEVRATVRMPLRTMSLSSVMNRDRITTHGVFSLGDRFQVLKVNAMSNPAEVVDGQPLWDRSDEVFIGEAMSFPRAPIPVEMAISVRRLRSHPQPARIREGDSSDKALDGRTLFSHRTYLRCHAPGRSHGAGALTCYSHSIRSYTWNHC